MLHRHFAIVIISTVFLSGFWFCQFQTGSLTLGLYSSSMINFLFGCSNIIYVLKFIVSDVCGLNLFVCCLCLFKNGRSGDLLFVCVSHFCTSFWCVSMAFEMY